MTPGGDTTIGLTTFVGKDAVGTLSIDGGSTVSDSTGHLGRNVGSSGTATVTGTGSKWTNSGSLYVGNSGSGTLTVSNGGLVTAKTLYASLSDVMGDGTIAVNGAVLDANLIFDSTHGTTQTLAFGSGGRLNLTIDGTSQLGAGYRGSGSLRIAEGRVVSSAAGYLGYNSVSNGTATVTGTGSKWTNSGPLYVGDSGSGTLTVSDGGLVTAKTLYASITDLLGDGTITAWGAVLDGNLVFDGTHGITQAIAFGTGGTLNLTVDGTVELGIGYRGIGSLRIADGIVVQSTVGYLGYRAGSTGTATVTGSGSKWTNSGDLYVGFSGNGTMTVMDGGQVICAGGTISYASGSTNTVTVSGTGSNWTNSGSLTVGNRGTLTVSDGGLVRVGAVMTSGSFHLNLRVQPT